MISIEELDMFTLGEQNFDLQSFDCGRSSVTEFFRNEALAYQDELFGKTYFFVLPNNPTKVVAGFTVANASIFTKHLSNSRQKKIGYEVHHKKGLINYPAVLLAQLGVDVKYRGNHIGEQIIRFVEDWFTSEDNKSGCRHLIVDAYNEPDLIDYYQRNGMNLFFTSVEQEMNYRNWNLEKDGTLETRLMYRDMILMRRNSIRTK